MSFLDKYPRTKSFLEKHPGWTLDQLFEWTEKQLESEVDKNEFKHRFHNTM